MIFGGSVREINSWKNKAVYLHLSGLLLSKNINTEPLKLIESWFESVGLNVKCVDEECDFSFIDHEGEIYYFAEVISTKPCLMMDFVFNPNSKIYTAMDTDFDSMAYKIVIEYSELGVFHGTKGFIGRGRKRNSTILYGKGN